MSILERMKKPLAGVRILCVDDNADALTLLVRVLRKYGASVATANSAAAARQQLGCGTFDLLLSDLEMPEEDGFSLARWLRENGRANQVIPAIAVSGHTTAKDRELAAQSGFQGFVSKPVDLSVLLGAIEDAVRPAA